MTSGAGRGADPMDPARMQLLVTGVREALDAARQAKSVPRFRRAADPSMFTATASGEDATPAS